MSASLPSPSRPPPMPTVGRLLCLLALLGPLFAGARPLPFKGAFNANFTYTGGEVAEAHAMLVYGQERNWGWGVHTSRWDADPPPAHHAGASVLDVDATYAALAHGSWLVRRWNQRISQANLYLLGAAGGWRDGYGETEPAGYLGFQADAEDRRFYGALLGEAWFPDESGGRSLTARAGVAPYIAGFNDLNTWLIVQTKVEFPEHGDEHWTVTPLVRFYYRTWLWEVGVSHRGDVFFNLDYTFRRPRGRAR